MKKIPILRVLSLCLACCCGNAQQGGDFQAQILYAFYVEDSNELASIAQLLQAHGAGNARRYDLAHASYRLGLLAVQKRAADAAFAQCVDALKPLLEQDGNSVEVLALQSACYSHLARLRPTEMLVLRSRADDRMRRAINSGPRNPRVELLRAEAEVVRAIPEPMESARALAHLLLAAEAFEQSSTTVVDEPGWGHAEVYRLLGELFERRGDYLEARNWLEKALIVAPDFKAAQRQMAGLLRRLGAAAGAATGFQPGMLVCDERPRHAAIVVRDS